jgi:TM2 domain-containing membrane protein YozV
MRNMIIVLVVTIGLSCLWALDCPAQDVVHTKNGGIFEGRIVEEMPNVPLVIQDMAGNRHRISWEDIDRIYRGEWRGKKSATTSWALSFFLAPGIGQFYNGDNAKGIAMLCAYAGGIGLSLRVEDAPWFGALVIVCDWVWSFIDAPLRSASINRQRDYLAADVTLSPGRYYALSWQENEVRQPSVKLTLVRLSF